MAQINLATIKTGFNPVFNTFDLDVVVAQTNKASVGIDSASTIGGSDIIISFPRSKYLLYES